MRPVRARRRLLPLAGSLLIVAALLPVAVAPVVADGTAQPLPYTQNWANTGLITVNDDWSGVPGVVGHRGDNLTSVNDVDPQTVLGEGVPVVDVNANQTNPDTFTTGGVTEFHISDPAVALTGSGTADAPSIVISVDTTGASSVNVSYNLRDIDGSTDNAAQQVALQYRLGATGDFTNVPAGYVSDATTGPSLATQVTAVAAALPSGAANQPLVQVRVITTNATGNDEWVGIDDIVIAEGDVAPAVAATAPANGAVNVELDADIGITFTEPVDVTGAWYAISCASSGVHTAAVSGGPKAFTLDPDADFGTSELCTVTLTGANITDLDTNDPPDRVEGDPSWSFTTEAPPPPPTFIRDIQGAGHTSPVVGTVVANVNGIVTAKRSNGFYMQDPAPDANDATSEGILVFTSSAPTVNVGDAVRVSGTVTEFRPGGASSNNLSITEIIGPTIAVVSTGNPLPAPTVIGAGGRTAPTTVIEDDAGGNVETGGVFDPAADGIDFYESLEGMRVQVNNPVVVGPRNSFGEVFVLADNGAGATERTARGGIVIRDLGPEPPGDYTSGDFNPERIQLDDAAGVATPNAHVGDHFTGPAVGVVDYDFGNFEVEVTAALTRVDNGLAREVTEPAAPDELSVATFNVENLDALEPQSKFDALAAQIVDNMGAPDIVSLEEIQDNNGATNDPVVDADQTLTKLIQAIQAAGGPTYEYRQINPVDDQDGGEPGGNIRVGFIFRTDRGVAFVDRAGGGPTTPTTIVTGPGGEPQLSSSPGRVDPANPAWNASRKPLAGEFTFRGETFFLITNHFNSKGGDQPLFGRFQPPTRSTEVQRHQQAGIVNNFVDSILALDSNANVIVLGDINDFEFSQTMALLEGGVLHSLMKSLPQNERYSYVFEGNSQSLDHIVVSDRLFGRPFEYDAVHINAEFFDQLSDHDPQVARFIVNSAPMADAGGPYAVNEGGSVTLSATGSDPNGDPLGFAWDLDNDGTFETSGQTVTFSAATVDGPSTHTVAVRVSDGTTTTTDTATVSVVNVAPTATLNAPASTFAGFPFTVSLTGASDPSAADTAAGFQYAFDCGGGAGYGAFGTASSVSCPTGDVGNRTVRATIRDKDGGTTEYTATVAVVVTYDSLCALGRTVVTSRVSATALCLTLALAEAADDRGNERTKQALLRAYRLQVDVFRRLGRVSAENAALLKHLSTRL